MLSSSVPNRHVEFTAAETRVVELYYAVISYANVSLMVDKIFLTANDNHQLLSFAPPT